MRIGELFVGFVALAPAAQAMNFDCFPQYSENSCQPNVSYSASVEGVGTGRTSVFIEKYMPGATVGLFDSDCVGNPDTGKLDCADPRNQGRFTMARLGSAYTGIYEGNEFPLIGRVWVCRQR